MKFVMALLLFLSTSAFAGQTLNSTIKGSLNRVANQFGVSSSALETSVIASITNQNVKLVDVVSLEFSGRENALVNRYKFRASLNNGFTLSVLAFSPTSAEINRLIYVTAGSASNSFGISSLQIKKNLIIALQKSYIDLRTITSIDLVGQLEFNDELMFKVRRLDGSIQTVAVSPKTTCAKALTKSR